MFRVVIPATDLFNEETQEFVTTPEYEFQIEHSLVSLSKWESKWQKPFLTKSDKTKEETIDYIRCMTITQNVNSSVYDLISNKVIESIFDYIHAPMTATTISQMNNKPGNQIITSEVIYYWMVTFNIPFECQKWHLNRLLTLISVCNIMNQPKKKKSVNESFKEQRSLNEARRAKYHTNG